MDEQIEPLATIDDSKQCALLMSSTEPWITLRRNYDQCLRLFLDRSLFTYIIKEGERVISFCVMDVKNFPRPYIRCLAVHADHRGRRLGTQMISKMEEWYGDVTGKMYIAVSSFNSGARKLYESLGFRKAGEFSDYAVEGHSEIILEKRLAPAAVVNKPERYVSASFRDMDIDFIYENLRTMYWSTNITRENLIGRMMNSICFGVFEDGRQKGFARVVTDYFSFAYLADVFVEEGSRGKGLSRLLMEYIMDFPVLRDQKWLLATRDAHALYEKFGFGAVANPDRFMGKNGWRAFAK